MGNEQSQTVGEAFGFRVLSVLPGSPGTAAKLESYFDFVVEAAGIRLDQNDHTFQDVIKSHLGKRLPLKVYNCMSASTRDVVLCPRLDWGGSGSLGITIRFDSFENAMSEAIHLLSVEDFSPAALAGLHAHSDYLLGTADAVFHDELELAETLSRNIDNPVEVFVYSSETEEVRRTTVTPGYAWGGDGLLGCGIGSGFLHQIPTVSSRRLANIVGGGDLASTIASKRVRCAPFGRGWVKDVRADNVYVVELDWTLANDGHAVLITQEQHLRFIMDEAPLSHGSSNGAAADIGVDMLKLVAEPRQPHVADEIPEPSIPTAVPAEAAAAAGQGPNIGGEGAPKDASGSEAAGKSNHAQKMEVDLS